MALYSKRCITDLHMCYCYTVGKLIKLSNWRQDYFTLRRNVHQASTSHCNSCASCLSLDQLVSGEWCIPAILPNQLLDSGRLYWHQNVSNVAIPTGYCWRLFVFRLLGHERGVISRKHSRPASSLSSFKRRLKTTIFEPLFSTHPSFLAYHSGKCSYRRSNSFLVRPRISIGHTLTINILFIWLNKHKAAKMFQTWEQINCNRYQIIRTVGLS